MIFKPNGSFYSKVQFKTEEEVEKVVVDNFKLLFGDFSILLPKSKILTSGGKGTIPDGIIVDFKQNRWFILEVERGDHETWGHIAPQINKQLVAVKNPGTKAKIVDLCLSEIAKQAEFANLLESELNLKQINIHGFVQRILEKDPIVSLPIDYSPSDLEAWAESLKVDVQIQHIEKYMDNTGDILYDFPGLELFQEKESLDAMNRNNVLFELVKAGLLQEGEIVSFDYGPKGCKKVHFEGKICSDGIEVDGVVSSTSVAALRCVQTVSPTRTTENGWVKWRTKDGKLLKEKWNALLKMNGNESSPKKPSHKKIPSGAIPFPEGSDILYHFAKGGAVTASVKRLGSSFVIQVGSLLSLKYDLSKSPSWQSVRELANVDEHGVLQSEIECDSSSMAATIVAGGARNGLIFWKTKDRKELKSL